MFQTIVQAVLRHAEHTPERLAIGFKEVRITYGQLAAQMKAAAYILKSEYGVEKQDRVMISATSKPEYIVALLGIQYLGAVSVPVDKAALEENIVDEYRFNESKLLLTDTRITDETVCKISLLKFYEKVLSEAGADPVYDLPDADLVGEMLFTTGTTGKPKGAMLTYRNIYASCHNTWKGVGMVSDDVVLVPLPLNHSVGMRVLRTILYIGAAIVIQNGFSFPKELISNIETYHCSGFVSVPASLERLYRQMGSKFAETLGTLRYMEIGAGSLSYDMKKKLVRLLPNTRIINTWGSTETGGAIFLNVSEHPDKLTSLGRPVDGVKVKVIDSEGNESRATDINTAGRMALQGEMQMAGYFRLPEATADALVDGWLYTNDMVYTDDDGYVYMLGRADDIINVGGEKVSPIEVENIAAEYGQIQECACIGVTDPEGILGQVPILYYVLEAGEEALDRKELVRFLSRRMEAYKMPHEYVQIDELPRNRMKKLNRKKLYERWEENGDLNVWNPIVETILKRRSVRNFKEQHIPRALLEMIVKAGLQAPSGHNMQSWRFTVIRNHEKIEELKNLVTKVAAEKNISFYGMNNPDAVILVSNDRRNENGIQDSACAAENMMLAAQSYGIGSVWVNALKTLCDEPEIRALLSSFGVSPKQVVWSMLCLGYPAGETKPVARRTDVVRWVE